MSSQLKEKTQQKDNKRDLDADSVFNQQLFRTLAYTGAGFGAGLVASVFLKNRKALTLLGAGSGAAYGASNFMNELNQFGRFKDMANQSQQHHTLKREDQLSTKNWEDYMPKQESQSQQKRHGGSGDDDDKGSKPNSESKSRDNKSNEKKGHEATATRPKTQAVSPSESLVSTPTGSKESQNLNTRSSHDKTLDKSSYDFGKGKGESPKSSSSGNDSQQSGSHKTNSPKTSSTAPKETDKSSQEQQKGGSQKSSGQSKEQQTSARDAERKGSSRLEPGQHLQDFSSYKEPGKPAEGESKANRGSERDVRVNSEVEDKRDHTNHRAAQDRWHKSRETGNRMKLETRPDNIAGGQFNTDDLTITAQQEVEM